VYENLISQKIQLKPTNLQKSYFIKACGTSRFVYNWGLAEWNKQYKEGLKPNRYKLMKQLNSIKDIDFPWMREVSKYVPQGIIADLGNAFDSFFAERSNYPKFKKKGKCKDSFRLDNFCFRIRDKKVHIAKLGWVKMALPLRFEGRPLSCTISRIADRWFASIRLELLDPIVKSRISDNTVGIDLGIKNSVVLSSNDFIQVPKPLLKLQKKLARLQRQQSRRQLKSKNRDKTNRKVSKLFYRSTCTKQDFLHKLTSKICSENQTIVIEDLSINGWKKLFGRQLIDFSPREFRCQLEYKSKFWDNNLIVADRFFPSSKTCSECGWINADLKLTDRVYVCPNCGNNKDRDLNAAINLEHLAHTDRLSGIYACGQCESLRSLEETGTSIGG